MSYRRPSSSSSSAAVAVATTTMTVRRGGTTTTNLPKVAAGAAFSATGQQHHRAPSRGSSSSRRHRRLLRAENTSFDVAAPTPTRDYEQRRGPPRDSRGNDANPSSRRRRGDHSSNSSSARRRQQPSKNGALSLFESREPVSERRRKVFQGSDPLNRASSRDPPSASRRGRGPSSSLLSSHPFQSPFGYAIGEAMRDPSHSQSFSSISQASILISKLPMNSMLFVKRTSGEWTCCGLIGRSKDASNEMIIAVSLSAVNKRKKKVLARGSWVPYLRLVNYGSDDGGGGSGLENAAPNPRRSIGCGDGGLSVGARSAAGCGSFEDAAATVRSSSTKPSAEFRNDDSISLPRRNSAPATSSLRRRRPGESASFRVPVRDGVRAAPATSSTESGSVPGGRRTFPRRRNSTPPSPGPPPRRRRPADETVVGPRPAAAVPVEPTTNDGAPAAWKISPDTVVAVNLRARHFSGSRRDRMRPSSAQSTRRGGILGSSSSSDNDLSRLGSLPGGSGHSRGGAAANDDDPSCDATCAPTSAGGGGGSLWISSWSPSGGDSSSRRRHSADRRAVAPPRPPYTTATTAKQYAVMPYGAPGLSFDATLPGTLSMLGAGMSMRLRGVDP